jgi:flagellar protein FlaG
MTLSVQSAAPPARPAEPVPTSPTPRAVAVAVSSAVPSAVSPSVPRPVPVAAVRREAPLPKTREPEAEPVPSQAQEESQLKQAVAELQRQTQQAAPNLEFSIDRQSGRSVIKVVDTGTKEVIRQIPSEEVLRLNQQLDKLQGLLFDKQA